MKYNSIMKYTELIPILLMACLLTACRPTTKTASSAGGLAVIHVEAAVSSLQDELKLSDLGSEVRYVPLETNDSCLIGRNAIVRIYGDKLVVASSIATNGFLCRDHILCFDKQSGRCLQTIGHTGEGPEDFSIFSDLIYHEKEGMLYIPREPDKLQKYDLQGNYHGQVTLPRVQGITPTSIVCCDSNLVGHYYLWTLPQKGDSSLLYFTPDGNVQKSIRTQPARQQVQIDYERFSTLISTYDPLTVIKTNGFNGGVVERVYRSRNFWSCDGQMRFKEDFNDTIYNVEGHGLRPSYVFHTGSYHFPAEALTHGAGHEDKVVIAGVLESPRKILFNGVQNLYSDHPKELYGIYDKQDGTTQMAPRWESLTDDLNGFMPFHPTTCSPQGEYAALLWPEEVLPWLEEHPEARNNPLLKPLFDIELEDNPVVVIVQ